MATTSRPRIHAEVICGNCGDVCEGQRRNLHCPTCDPKPTERFHPLVARFYRERADAKPQPQLPDWMRDPTLLPKRPPTKAVAF